MVGRAVRPVVRRIEVIHRPRRRRIARGVDRDVGARMVGEHLAQTVNGADEEDDGVPGVRRRLVVATRIAGELGQALVEEDIDVERTGDTMAIGAVDGVGRVHRFDHEAIADAQPLIGWLELRAKVADAAIAAADAIKVRQQRASMLIVERSSSLRRALEWMDAAERYGVGRNAASGRLLSHSLRWRKTRRRWSARV